MNVGLDRYTIIKVDPCLHHLFAYLNFNLAVSVVSEYRRTNMCCLQEQYNIQRSSDPKIDSNG